MSKSAGRSVRWRLLEADAQVREQAVELGRLRHYNRALRSEATHACNRVTQMQSELARWVPSVDVREDQIESRLELQTHLPYSAVRGFDPKELSTYMGREAEGKVYRTLQGVRDSRTSVARVCSPPTWSERVALSFMRERDLLVPSLCNPDNPCAIKGCTHGESPKL